MAMSAVGLIKPGLIMHASIRYKERMHNLLMDTWMIENTVVRRKNP